MSQDKMSQDKTLQDKMSRTYRRGQNVADKLLRTKCCLDKMLPGQNVARTKRCKKNVAWTNGCEDKMLHGQNVAWTKCCKDKTSRKKRRRMIKYFRRTKSSVDKMVHGSFVGNLEFLVTSNVKQISRYNLFFTLIT
jgi:hypothetical protein